MTWIDDCGTLTGNWIRQSGKGKPMTLMASPVEVLAQVRTDVACACRVGAPNKVETRYRLMSSTVAC